MLEGQDRQSFVSTILVAALAVVGRHLLAMPMQQHVGTLHRQFAGADLEQIGLGRLHHEFAAGRAAPDQTYFETFPRQSPGQRGTDADARPDDQSGFVLSWHFDLRPPLSTGH